MKKQIKFFVAALLVTLLAFCLIGCTKSTTVTFKQANETIVATVIADKEGKIYVPSVTAAEGYVIEGWYTTTDYSGEPVDIAQTAFTQNTTLYAKVSAKSYTLNYNLGYENATGTPGQVTFNIDGTFTTAPTPEREGYVFTGWASDDTVYEAGQTITADFIGDRTLVATWETKLLTVRFFDDVGLLTIKENVPYGSDVIAPLAPHTYSWCYEFDNWDKKLTKITEDIEVNAVYEYIPTQLPDGNQYEFTEVYDGEGQLSGYSLKIPGNNQPYFQLPNSVALPNEHNGRPIVEISESALSYQNTMQKLYVPGSIKTINAAIMFCDRLEIVVFEEGVEILKSNELYGAIYSCKRLKEVYIPSTLSIVEHKAFLFVGDYTEEKMPEFICADGGNFVFEDNTFKSADGKKIIYTDRYVANFHVDEKAEDIYPGLFMTWDCDSPLESVIIDGHINIIYENTFSNCMALRSVTFNGTIGEIKGYKGHYDNGGNFNITGASAFGGCYSLIQVNLPYGLKKIGDGAFFDSFFNCSGWSEIVLPNSLEYIGWDAFTNIQGYSSGITSIKMVDENGQQVSGNDYYMVENNCIIAKNVDIKISDTQTIKGDSLYIYAAQSSATSYTVPSSVREIKEFAFAYTRYLENLSLPEGMTEIKAGCIGGSIYNRSEYVGSSIINLNIPDSVTVIRSSTLCIGGNSLSGYGGITYLPNLTTLTIGQNSLLTSIEDQAMIGLGVETFFVPASVTHIGAFAINGENLTKFEVDTCNEYYCAMDGVLFDKDITNLILYPWGKSDIDYAIPSTVTDIKASSMSNTEFLENVTLPASVTILERGVFWNSNALKTITFEGNKAPHLQSGMPYIFSKNMRTLLDIDIIAPVGAYYSYLGMFLDYDKTCLQLLSKEDQSLTVYEFELGASPQNIPDENIYIETLPFPDSYVDGTTTMYFIGWFTADGTDGEWGEEISGSPYYYDDSGTIVTLYARFKDQERREGTQLFPWYADDTEFRPFKLKGEIGEISYIKFRLLI